MGKSKASAKSSASGFCLDYNCALSVRSAKARSKSKARHSGKGDSK